MTFFAACVIIIVEYKEVAQMKYKRMLIAAFLFLFISIGAVAWVITTEPEPELPYNQEAEDRFYREYGVPYYESTACKDECHTPAHEPNR